MVCGVLCLLQHLCDLGQRRTGLEAPLDDLEGLCTVDALEVLDAAGRKTAP